MSTTLGILRAGWGTISTERYRLFCEAAIEGNLLIKDLYKKNYEDRQRILGLTSLEERRQRGHLIEIFKLLT